MSVRGRTVGSHWNVGYLLEILFMDNASSMNLSVKLNWYAFELTSKDFINSDSFEHKNISGEGHWVPIVMSAICWKSLDARNAQKAFIRNTPKEK